LISGIIIKKGVLNGQGNEYAKRFEEKATKNCKRKEGCETGKEEK
jgi:hypothetical protein